MDATHASAHTTFSPFNKTILECFVFDPSWPSDLILNQRITPSEVDDALAFKTVFKVYEHLWKHHE
jgi:hypothetical protein